MSVHTAMAELVEIYALDSLDGLERVTFEVHLADCGECDGRLARCEDALAALVPDDVPPVGVWARVSAVLDRETAVRRARFPRLPPGVVIAIAAAVLIALGGVLLTSPTSGNESLLAAAERAAAAPGASVVQFTDGGQTLAEVVLTAEGVGYVVPTADLPALDTSRTYQLWVVDQDGRVISGGVLGNRPDISAFTWSDGLTGLVLTRERAGGVEQSEGDIVSAIEGI